MIRPLRDGETLALNVLCDRFARLGLRALLPLDLWLGLDDVGRGHWERLARIRLARFHETPPTVASLPVCIQ